MRVAHWCHGSWLANHLPNTDALTNLPQHCTYMYRHSHVWGQPAHALNDQLLCNQLCSAIISSKLNLDIEQAATSQRGRNVTSLSPYSGLKTTRNQTIFQRLIFAGNCINCSFYSISICTRIENAGRPIVLDIIVVGWSSRAESEQSEIFIMTCFDGAQLWYE